MAKTKYSKCPKCGSTNIVWNKDVRNAFIQCRECGHYLRKGQNKLNKPCGV